MAPSDLSIIMETSNHFDDPSPDYNVAVSRSNTTATSSSQGVHWSSPPYDPTAPLSITPRNTRHARYIYTYSLLAGAAPLQFFISVEPESGRPLPGNCTFRLSFKANAVERSICKPLTLRLTSDPRELDFAVFAFPGKTSMPAGCLYSVRVWLRTQHGIDHRIFGEDDLWVGKDPDFHSLPDASFARIKGFNNESQTYHAVVGRAQVTFIVRWQIINAAEKQYRYSLEYEAGGVGAVLFQDLILNLECPPHRVSFLIYSVPIPSQPAGASHRLRIWLRTLLPTTTSSASRAVPVPFADSYIYQRVWKSDKFKIGACLDFGALGNKFIVGSREGGGPRVVYTRERSGEEKVSMDDAMIEY